MAKVILIWGLRPSSTSKLIICQTLSSPHRVIR
jgi:hypothetical protein